MTEIASIRMSNKRRFLRESFDPLNATQYDTTLLADGRTSEEYVLQICS